MKCLGGINWEDSPWVKLLPWQEETRGKTTMFVAKGSRGSFIIEQAYEGDGFALLLRRGGVNDYMGASMIAGIAKVMAGIYEYRCRLIGIEIPEGFLESIGIPEGFLESIVIPEGFLELIEIPKGFPES